MSISDFLVLCLGGALGLLVSFMADRLPAFATTPSTDNTGIPEKQKERLAPARGKMVRVISAIIVLAGLCLYVFRHDGLSWAFTTKVFYLALFTLITIIDLEHRLVLNIVMIPAFCVSLVEILLHVREIKPIEAFAGFAIAQIVLMGIYLMGQGYLFLVNKRRKNPVSEVPFGFGDVTLATFCGLVIGFPRVVLMLVLMIFIGGFMAVLLVLGQAIFSRTYKAQVAMPYGPAIVVATLVMMLWGEAVARLLGAY